MVEAEHYQLLFDQTQCSLVSLQQSIQLGDNDSLRVSAEFHSVEGKDHANSSFQEFKLECRHYFKDYKLLFFSNDMKMF